MSVPEKEAPSDETPSETPIVEAVAETMDSGKAAPSLKGVPRVVSLIVLLAVVLLIGVMFFRVMASFLVPLFLAAVLTVVFKPLHEWMLEKCERRKRLAALATTTLISLGVLVPTALLGWMAYLETTRVVRVALAAAESADNDEEAAEAAVPVEPTVVAPADEDDTVGEEGWAALVMQPFELLTEWTHENLNAEIDPSKLAQSGAQYAVQFGLVGVQSLLGFFLGMGIMIFALYYFFADGPAIVESLMHLSPLDDDYEHELLVQFTNVSRAVVLATLLAAVVQGLLAGIGYYFVVDEWAPAPIVAQHGGDLANVPDNLKVEPPLILLTVLTILLAIVPFVGATAVWVPVALWVYFVQGDLWPAVGMAVYGFGVVSSIDNVIKPYVLHGQSNLHPLLALLSVLGGIQLLGPIGILVGPMLVAFMQALLQMLRKELDVLGGADEAATA